MIDRIDLAGAVPALPATTIAFAKMHGSGNDFVVIDHRQPVIPAASESAFVRAICERRTGIGADGVVFIEHVDPMVDSTGEADFRWRYINADGSEVDMCGNGAMCGARFAVLNAIAPTRCAFQTPAGLVRAEVSAAFSAAVSAECGAEGTGVRLGMVDSGPLTPSRLVATSFGDVAVASILVGVPHAVVVTEDADAWPQVGTFDAAGRELRLHAAFAPTGTNVNILSSLGPNRLRMRTYERGVEAETLACGTGAIATAIVASRQGLVDPTHPIVIDTSCGWPLVVDFTWNEETQSASGITLAGQAIVVARGELDAEAWHALALRAGR